MSEEMKMDVIPAPARLQPGPPINAVNPSSSAAAFDKGNNRIIAGGGWDNDFRMCNLAARYSAPPTRVADNIGFRVRCLVNQPSN